MNRKRAVTEAYYRWRARPFSWSDADCLTFAGEVALAITGRDPGRDLRRRYSSRVGVRRLLVREGWKDLGDLAASLLPEVPVGHALSGDWVHVRDELGNECIGVVCGHMAVVCTEAGTRLLPMAWARRAFRVE